MQEKVETALYIFCDIKIDINRKFCWAEEEEKIICVFMFVTGSVDSFICILHIFTLEYKQSTVSLGENWAYVKLKS